MTCLLAAVTCALLAQGALNDISKTPGAVRTTNKADICSSHTSAIRNVSTATKNKVFKLYGLTNKTGWCKQSGCEVDHLISLELGGSNDIKNLWPQSNAASWNAHQKDALENRLHKLICDGTLTPRQAQNAISQNWVEAYKKYLAP